MRITNNQKQSNKKKNMILVFKSKNESTDRVYQQYKYFKELLNLNFVSSRLYIVAKWYIMVNVCCVHCTAHIVYKHGMHDELYISYEKQRYELQYLHGLNITNFLVFNYYQN